jgi:hypothetical protein
MIITVERSGGLAGRPERLGPVDTKRVEPNVGARLEAKVEEAGFFDLPERLPGGEGSRDTFNYTVSVSDDYRRHTVAYNELSDEAERAGLKDLVEMVEQTGVGWDPTPFETGA